MSAPVLPRKGVAIDINRVRATDKVISLPQALKWKTGSQIESKAGSRSSFSSNVICDPGIPRSTTVPNLTLEPSPQLSLQLSFSFCMDEAVEIDMMKEVIKRSKAVTQRKLCAKRTSIDGKKKVVDKTKHVMRRGGVAMELDRDLHHNFQLTVCDGQCNCSFSRHLTDRDLSRSLKS